VSDPVPGPPHDLNYAESEVNGITLRYIDEGEGPLVLLLHGFPDLAFSWRHQVRHLSAAGYRVVAPDLRGYGPDAPQAVEAYTYFDIIGDLVALMDELGYQDVVVAGHDMGSYVAWHMALLLPQRVRAVAGLSVAHRRRRPEPPMSVLEATFGPDFYQVRFQQPAVVDEELERRAEAFLRGIYVGLSADAAEPVESLMIPPGKGFADLFPAPDALPAWLGEDDLAAYVDGFARSGFTGPLNWYRNADRNWALLAPWAKAAVQPPAIYLAGERDIAYRIAVASGALTDMEETVADLRGTIVVPDCGHWVNQEKPEAVNEALLELLAIADQRRTN
jgi:pimeloyl-ACP methyl ester carboxylesterase